MAAYFVRGSAFQRVNRPAVLFLDADNKVTAAPVVNVVGKGADCLERRLGISGLLKLDPARADTPSWIAPVSPMRSKFLKNHIH